MLYADVFINLNFYFESLTKFKHNYDYFGLQVDEETWLGTAEEEESKRIKHYIVPAVPFYILWTFVPISYLEKEKRQAKLICFAISALFASLEILFLTQYFPEDHVLNQLIFFITPNHITFWEFFNFIQSLVPYVILICIAIQDIFVYESHLKDPDEQDTSDLRFSHLLREQEGVLSEYIVKLTDFENKLRNDHLKLSIEQIKDENREMHSYTK